MKSLISQKINKLFVTAVFIGIQTVFLLLPSFILNAFNGVNEDRIVGTLITEYLADENKVKLNWIFENSVLNINTNEDSAKKYRVFKINSEKEEYLYTIDAERQTSETNEFIWNKNLSPGQNYSFGVCRLSLEGVCELYTGSQRVFINEIDNPKKDIEIVYSGPSEIFVGDSIEIISNTEDHKIFLFHQNSEPNYQLHLAHYIRLENAYFYEISNDEIPAGNFYLIARVISIDNIVIYEKKWSVRISEQKINERTEEENYIDDTNITKAEDNLNENLIEEYVNTDSVNFYNWPEEINENERLFIKSTNKIDAMVLIINRETRIDLIKDSDTLFYINSNILIEKSKTGVELRITGLRDGAVVAENKRFLNIATTEENILENKTTEENKQETSLVNEIVEKEEFFQEKVIEEIENKSTEEEKSEISINDNQEILKNELLKYNQEDTEKNELEQLFIEEKNLDFRCLIKGINNKEKCIEYLKIFELDKRCLNIGIEEKDKCDTYLAYPAKDRICIHNNFLFEEDCNDFLVQKIKKVAECFGDNCKERMEEIIRKDETNSAKRKIFESIKEEKQVLEDMSVYRDEMEIKLGIPERMIPIINNKRLGILDSLDRVMVNMASEEVVQSSPVVLFIDSDGDGLPDDLEIRIGTDPYSSDTDGDGYSDLEEILNGYNPLGEGLLPDDLLSPIDWAILRRNLIEQPKISGDEADNLLIEEVIVLSSSFNEEDKEEGIIISGKAEPETVVSIYLYSDIPILFTTKTDKDGNFIYEIKDSLSEGDHQIFIAINDNTGKIKTKSRAFSFFVGEAQAVDENSILNIADLKIAPQNIETETKSIAHYLYLGIFLIMLSSFAFVLYFIKYKQRNVA